MSCSNKKAWSFLLFWALLDVRFPAVTAPNPAVEEEVALLAWNLETDIAEACSRNDGCWHLVQMTADLNSINRLPALLLLLVGRLV